MKKFLLLLSIVLLFFSGEVLAQRRTATTDFTIKGLNCDVKQEYSYILNGGEQVFDGPVKVSGGFGTVKNAAYGWIHRISGTQSYAMKANHSNGKLHGDIAMTYNYKMSATNGEHANTSIVYNGSFANGLPNGSFRYTIQGNEYSNTAVDATFKNGVLVGSFHCKFDCYEMCDITGNFTADGKFNGTWTVKYKNRGSDNESGTDIHQFQNGVMVGGDEMSTDPTIKSLSQQYASGKITKEQLEKKGYVVERSRFLVYGGSYNLYEFVCDKLFCGGTVNYDKLGWFKEYDDTKDGLGFFERIAAIDYINDEEFKRYVLRLFDNVGNDRLTLDFAAPLDEELNKRYALSGNYYGAYKVGYLTDAQVEITKQELDKYNAKADAKYESLLKSEISNNLSKKYICISGVYYEVISHTFVEYRGRGKGVLVKFNCRAKDAKDGAYSTYTADADIDFSRSGSDNLIISNFVRCRNKYDDLADVEKAISVAEKKVSLYVSKLYQDGVIAKYGGVSQQVAKYRAFVEAKPAVNHNNLDATIALYENRLKEVTYFDSFICKYVELCQLHEQICNTKAPVLNVYYSLYQQATDGLISWKDGSSICTEFMNIQKSVQAYLIKYAHVLEGNNNLKKVLKPAKCAAKAYAAYYSRLDLNWQNDLSIKKIDEVLLRQSLLMKILQRPTLKADEARVKKLKLTDLDSIIDAYLQ